MKQNQYAVDILKTAARQTDDIAQAFALDETGKSVVYRYCVKLLTDCLIHGVNIEDEFYMDSMADYLEQQLTLFNSAYADNVTAACISIHAHAAVAQNGEKKIARNTRAERF